MRNALKKTAVGLARILPLLLMVALVAVTNASAAAESYAMGAGGYMGIAPGTALALGAGAVGLGAVLRLDGQNEDGDPASVTLDTDNDDSQGLFDKIQRAAKLKAQEIIGPTQEQLEAAQGENSTFRDALIGEIVRVEKLSAGDDYDTEAEREFYDGLPAERLTKHYRRKVVEQRSELSVEQATTEGEPQGPEEDDLYSELSPSEDE